MQKILFVCLGNICRSPLGEGIMLHLIEKNNLPFQVDSASTSNYHVGEAPDKRTIANAETHGVDLTSLRARQFTTNDFDAFDKIFVMDNSNLFDVLSMAKTEEHKQKVSLLLDLTHPGQQKEVPDPYFGGEQGFENVFNLVFQACEKIVELKINV